MVVFGSETDFRSVLVSALARFDDHRAGRGFACDRAFPAFALEGFRSRRFRIVCNDLRRDDGNRFFAELRGRDHQPDGFCSASAGVCFRARLASGGNRTMDSENDPLRQKTIRNDRAFYRRNCLDVSALSAVYLGVGNGGSDDVESRLGFDRPFVNRLAQKLAVTIYNSLHLKSNFIR